MTRLLSLILLASAAASAAPILTLDPTGPLTGSPGTTIGWGYTIQNDTGFYLIVTSVTPTGFDLATGTFSDYIASVNFTLVNPNTTGSQAFNLSLTEGFGQFAILNSALIGAATGADFEVTYDLLVHDPNGPLGSDPSDILGNTFPTTSAEVRVTDPIQTAATPEPSTGAYIAIALGCFVAIAASCRKRSCKP